MPIVGVSVGGKYGQPTRREFAFDDIGPRQTGDAEERREIFGIAQCRADVRNAPVDLATHFLDRQLAEPRRMILAVRADSVTFLVDAAHGGGKGAGHLTDQEVSRFHALRSENVEDLVGIGQNGTVVKSQDHFFVGQRQRVRILHVADSRI